VPVIYKLMTSDPLPLKKLSESGRFGKVTKIVLGAPPVAVPMILVPSSLSVVVVQHDEGHVNRTASMLEWYDSHIAYCTFQHLVQTKKKITIKNTKTR